MKLKKNISRILMFSILLNNIYFHSNANSLNRYEIIEGETVTLEDVESDDITEIEIFGNTVQNPDNLEDIQSIGELYVNENGEPILDRQDREQYKIEIESSNIGIVEDNLIHRWTFDTYDGSGVWVDIINGYNMNLINTVQNKDGIYFGMWDSKGVVSSMSNVSRIEFDWKFIENRKSSTGECHLFSANNNNVRYGARMSDNYPRRYGISRGETTGKFNSIGDYKFSYIESDTPLELNNITFGYFQHGGSWSDMVIKEIRVYSKTFDLEKSLNNETYSLLKSNGNYNSNKITILLPCQLMKVGNTTDRLYWDNEEEKYVVKKNILKFTPTSVTRGISESSNYDSIIFYRVNGIGAKDNKLIVGSNIYTGNRSSDWVNLKIDSKFYYEQGYTLTESDANRFLRDYPTTVICATTNPQLIETNIIKQIQLTTYPDKTYISVVSKNGIKPTLKIKIDRIEQVSGEAVDNTVSNPTSNNIALARMFVNMLPESLYKDQLQAKLNEIFSEDIVLEKQSATANLDVYVKSENILMMSLDTNTVTFEDYSGVEELELKDAINISINSSLPYSLNAYVVGEITNKDKNKTLDLDVLNIKDNSQLDYKQFDSINSKLVLLDNVEKGNGISHNIDLKLSGNKAHDADVYKTTIKFEAEQK